MQMYEKHVRIKEINMKSRKNCAKIELRVYKLRCEEFAITKIEHLENGEHLTTKCETV